MTFWEISPLVDHQYRRLRDETIQLVTHCSGLLFALEDVYCNVALSWFVAFYDWLGRHFGTHTYLQNRGCMISLSPYGNITHLVTISHLIILFDGSGRSTLDKVWGSRQRDGQMLHLLLVISISGIIACVITSRGRCSIQQYSTASGGEQTKKTGIATLSMFRARSP